MAIKIDVVTDLDKRRARDTAAEAQRYFEAAGRDAGNSFGTNLSQGIDKASPKVEKSARNIEKSFDKAADAAGRLRVEQEKLDALISKGDSSRSVLIAQSERVERARRSESSAVRDVSDAYRDFSSVTQAAGSAATGAASSFAELGSSMGKMGPIGIGIAIAGLGNAIVQVGGIAASAAQSLLLIPAAAGAAGAAFGTLALATLGFGDAIKDIRDPEKFAEDLRALSPVAQEAALAIQSLLPSFDQLKNATQDAFFNNVGTMLNQLTNQYLPTIQSATTGIASAFNSMLQGATNQLMTPETQASIQAFLSNVVTGFQNLAPAVAPLTKALADLMAAGSGFLPGLAQAATDAANAFSQFISQASKSGDLNKWIGEGIATLKDLGSIAWDLAKSFMSLAPLARDTLPVIREMMHTFADLGPVAVNVFESGIAPALGVVASGIKVANDGFMTMKSTVNTAASAMIPVLNQVADAVNAILAPMRLAIDGANALGANIPQIGVPHLAPVHGGGGRVLRPAGGLGTNLDPAGIGPGSALPTGQGLGSGLSYRPPPADAPFAWAGNLPGYTPARGAGGGGAAATPFVDPTKFTLGDPLAGMPAPVAGADQQAVFDADSKLITATHDLEQKKLALQVLEAKGNASQQELLTAKNDLQEKERALASAQADDVAVRTGQMKKAAEGLKEIQGIFAPMDDDLGISGGLPGIAKYFTTLLGNFALAGAIQSSPTLQAGALSIISGGNGGALGYGGGYGGGALGGMSGGPVGAPIAGESSRDFAHRVMMPFWQSQGLTVGDHGADKYGEHQNGALDIMVSNLAEGTAVLQQVLQDPNVHGAIFNNQTYGYGHGLTPRDYSAGHTGDPSQDHTNHVHAWYEPGAQGNITPAAMGPTPIGGGLGGPLPGPGGLGGSPGITANGAVAPGQWGPGGLPSMGGMGGGLPGMGMGMPSALGSGYQGVGVGASNPQSMQPASTGGGGVGPGGITDAAAGAASALDVLAPGAGQAASVGIKLAGRAIQQAGQYAAIGVGGLMETFLPHDSPLAGNSWVSKIAGGISGVKPASKNLAGQASPPQPGAASAQGPVTNDHSVNIANMSTEGKDGQAVTNDIARYQAGGPR